jgi:hypothetical protein
MFNAGCGLDRHPFKFEKPFDISNIEVAESGHVKIRFKVFQLSKTILAYHQDLELDCAIAINRCNTNFATEDN